ncbi:MAG TPA: dTMP kinase, partial [Pyrinomonadaceae bacterium]
MRGKFITFEGIDGSGKSTQARLLAGELRLRGYDVLATMEPGGTPLGRRLREAFLETEEEVAPLAELLLFAADRAQHVEFLVKPALQDGKIVVSDRFADATAAYQGAGRGFPEKTINQIVNLATRGLQPDLTLFFD